MLAHGNYFLCKISRTVEVTGKKGKKRLKKIPMQFIVQSDTYTEAEICVPKICKVYSYENCTVPKLDKAKFSEIHITDNGEYFFEATIGMMTYNERSGAEKWTNERWLVEADDIDEAMAIVKENNKDTVSDWKVVNLKQSKIEDVHRFKDGNLVVAAGKETALDNDKDTGIDNVDTDAF